MKKLFILICFWQIPYLISAQDIGSLKAQKPVSISGGLHLGFNTYSNLEGRQRLDPFSWTISASPVLSVYGIQMPFFFLINQQSQSYAGPFQQFGMSPNYKWARLHLGYRNLNYSNYTLAGRLFFGAGIDLNPGKLRFSAMYGRFQQANRRDTTQKGFGALPTAFRRMGYAVKLGYGSAQNFIDVIYTKGWDEANSIQVPINEILTPSENTTLGIVTQTTFFKRLTWSNDIGVSGYNSDANAKELTGDLSIKSDFLRSLFKLRRSSQVGYAAFSSLRFNSRYISLQVQYRLISTDYKSMGAYFFNNDVQEIVLNPSLSLFNGKVNLNGSYGIQKDNVSKTKATQTERNIGSLNLSIQPSQNFGLMVTYSNYGTFQNNPDRIIDTLKIQQVNQSLVFAPRYSWGDRVVSHALNLMTSYQNSTDYNTVSKQLLEFNNLFVSLNYSRNNSKQKFNVSPGVLFIKNFLSYGNSSSLGANLNISKNFKRFSNSLTANYNQNYYQDEANGYTLNARWNGRIKVTNKQQLSLGTSLLYNKDLKFDTRNFTEIYTQAGYSLNF
ncbi:hypothetical protein [Flectobacillus major]|uniref:hypothetical protein n=1 Tax=Flectobacillus major TaxID=103 RepID=UPI000424B59B|nr:hypothetical protein [Flectobacillus major]